MNLAKGNNLKAESLTPFLSVGLSLCLCLLEIDRLPTKNKISEFIST